MNLKIKNKHTGKELPIQRMYITSQARGQLECSFMPEMPDDKEFTVIPFGIDIELTKMFEPNKPDFKVIAPLI